MRYTSKDQLLASIRGEHEKLLASLADLSPEQRTMTGVWGDEWTVKDLVAHLAEWQRMFLRWYRVGAEGREPEMPAAGYKWNETPRLNRDIQARHRDRPWDEVRMDFDRGHREIVALVESLSEEQLLEPGHFAWTGGNALTTYLGANTASHYRFGIKVLKRWKRSLGRDA